MTIVKRVLTEKFHMSDVIIEKAHRTGKKSARPRQIIFKLNNYEDKMTIFSKKRGALDDVSYYFTDDVTDMDLNTKRALKPVMDKARSEGKEVKFRNGKLFIGGYIYRGPIPAAPTFAPVAQSTPMMPPGFAGAYAPVPPSTPVAGAWGMTGPYAHVPPPVPPSVPGPSGVAGASAPPHTSPGGSMDSQATDV